MEIPLATKARLGLDDARSWIVLNEANRFIWPGPTSGLSIRRVGAQFPAAFCRPVSSGQCGASFSPSTPKPRPGKCHEQSDGHPLITAMRRFARSALVPPLDRLILDSPGIQWLGDCAIAILAAARNSAMASLGMATP